MAIQPPADPQQSLQQYEAFLAQMKAQLASGDMKEVHEYLEGGAGYLLTGDLPPEKVMETLGAWSPWVLFELHQTIKFPRPIEIAIAITKARIAMMK